MACQERTGPAGQTIQGRGATCPTGSSPLSSLVEAARRGAAVTFEQVVQADGYENLTVGELLAIGNPVGPQGQTVAHAIAGTGRFFSVDEIALLGDPPGENGTRLSFLQLMWGKIYTAAEVRRLGNPLSADGEPLSTAVYQKTRRPWAYPELLEMGVDLPLSADGYPIIFQEQPGWLDGYQASRYQITAVQSGPDAEDVQIRIGIKDQSGPAGYRPLSEAELNNLPEAVREWANRRRFELCCAARFNPLLTVQGQTIPLEAQYLASGLAGHYSVRDYQKALAGAFPLEYRQMLAADEPVRGGAEERAIRRKAFLALLPHLGFSPRDLVEVEGFFAASRHRSLKPVLESTFGRYLQQVRPMDAYILGALAQGIDRRMPPDQIAAVLTGLFPAYLFDGDWVNKHILVDPLEDPQSRAGVEARLSRGESVPLDTLLKYPDLMARFGI